jgi:serine/threonine protein kinase
VKIIDFGTAKIYENEFENIVIGTLYYMAPEVLIKNILINVICGL